MKNTLIKYVKRRNKPVGCFVAHLDNNGEVKIAFSLCRKTDKYNKELGRKIALERILKQDSFLPISLKDDMVDFIGRCKRYFKNNKINTQFVVSLLSKNDYKKSPFKDKNIKFLTEHIAFVQTDTF